MKIVAISDTHWHYPEDLPDGDILVFAGDASGIGTYDELTEFDNWMGTYRDKYRRILFTPGNHDYGFELGFKLKNAEMYINESVVVEGIKFWFSPYSIKFGTWGFMKPEKELDKMWYNIPEFTDVVVTHGPPKGELDLNVASYHIGSESLTRRIKEIKPRYHIFGHAHEAYGIIQEGVTTFCNVSLLNEYYMLVNKPTVLEI